MVLGKIEPSIEWENQMGFYKLDAANLDRLRTSSPIMCEWSKAVCASKPTGGMEEWAKESGQLAELPDTCAWYHGTWQFLRLINMVAVPPWYEFYAEALGSVLSDRPNAKVLISAAADYGMLCTLHQAVRATNSAPEITVCDICESPLMSCQWYAEQNDLEISCICADLLTTEKLAAESYDLIVTDELLTVLKTDSKPLIAARWNELLKRDGTIVTTAMLGEETTAALRRGFAHRACRLLDVHLDRFDGVWSRADLQEQFETFATYHTRHMLSGEDELRSLFSDFDLAFSITETPGECVNPTSSYQIVARPAKSSAGRPEKAEGQGIGLEV